jgi:hypothetical protein
MLTTRRLVALLALAAVTGCDETLTVEPVNEVEEKGAIIDAGSARAALAGIYDGLQDGSYYGGDYLFFTELPSDNAEHVGTFTAYADIDQHVTAADNGTIEAIWDAIYETIGRSNIVIAKVPGVAALDDAEKDDIVGQAYLIRALNYHNLVKLWGPVPIRTAPPLDLGELTNTERATVDQVYTQILADLTQAASLLGDNGETRKASLGAVDALRSRVLLYRQDWAGTVAAANATAAFGYDLAENFGDLFDPEGGDTPEDILRTSFTATEYNLAGYYYISKSFGGRWELAPTANVVAAFETDDARKAWTLDVDSRNRRFVAKFPTTVGAEDLHVIRYGEVLLNKAEALARQGLLQEALDAYNPLRVRAGLAPHTLGSSTQADVINAVLLERRRELAFEGDRWPDLVRTAHAVPVLGIPAFRALWPIPQNELDVAPKLVQNQGY